MADLFSNRQTSIATALDDYLHSVALARSQSTCRTYRNGLRLFREILKTADLDPGNTPAAELPEEAIAWLAMALKNHAPATERLYLTAAVGFYEYLAAEELATINLSTVRLLVRQRARRLGVRLPQFPVSQIELMIDYADRLPAQFVESDSERLRNYRDRAFLITLADTGLRVHEACGLHRGDIDWNEGRAVITGKGDRQAVVRFSRRAQLVIRDYLKARAVLDGTSGRQLSALPLFARHDRGAGKQVKPITTTTGRNIVADHVRIALGGEAVGSITPHSFRHYFVTRILQASGNLKLAQALARHQNIAVTQRYAHLSDNELDRGYWEVFEE